MKLAEPLLTGADWSGVDCNRAFRTTTALLVQAGIESPVVDAKTLLSFAWQITTAEVGAHLLRGTPLPAQVARTYALAVARRYSREPLQHITGVAHFRHLSLTVGPGVFIPRPETELLVEAVLQWHKKGPDRLRIADLCAGTGALGLAIATEIPGTELTLVEKSPLAGEYAQKNLAAVQPDLDSVSSVADLVVADALVWEPEAGQSLDAVVTNPPYVAHTLQPDIPEVTRHDPAVALYGGGDLGLDFPIALVYHAAGLLRPAGLLVMEHAEYQSEHIRLAFASAGLHTIATHRDYTGRDRFTTGHL